MTKNSLIILLLLISCTPKPSLKQENNLISDLDSDFPTTDTIILKPRQTFEIGSDISSVMIKDSTIFVYEHNNENFGHCYNINNGKQVSTLLTRGRAAYEMTTRLFVNNKFLKDSLQFYDEQIRVIKTFAINDILTKKIGERDFSVAKVPDSIYAKPFIKTDNNAIIGYNIPYKDGNNYMKKNFIYYDGKNISYFGELKEELFDMTNNKANKNINRSTLNYIFTTKGNKVVAANYAGIMLQVIDADKKTIDSERYYNKILSNRYEGTNGLCAHSIDCDEKYIYCLVMTPNENESENKSYIFVFDWELNPVKKYYMGSHTNNSGRYYLSADNKAMYFITTEEDKKVLFEGKFC